MTFHIPRALSGTHPHRRRGSVMVYSILSLTALSAIVSLAVDYGHVQAVKVQMQRSAEAVARGYFDFQVNNQPVTYTTLLEGQAYNPVDPGSGVTPTYTILAGSWNLTTQTFTSGGVANGSNLVSAVQVTVSRLAANGKSVPLTFGKLVGKPSCDVHAVAVAALIPGASDPLNVPRNADPYLAGMPSGTVAAGGWGDTTSNATPYQMSSFPVTPGTYITVTNTSGTSSIYPGHTDSTGADGDSSLVLHHGENYNGNPDPTWPNPENGVADAKMPSDALTGLFLTDTAPDQNATPASVDWTDAAHANLASYTNLAVQQPFLIGNGQTTGGTTQTFLVPPGATRLFLSIWDGVDYHNNSGGLSGTIGLQSKVMVVQQQ